MFYLILGMIANIVLLEFVIQQSTILTYKIVAIFLFLIVSSNIIARVTKLLFNIEKS